jgi:hypothetical protein
MRLWFFDGNVIFQCKWLVFASIKQWSWPKVIPIYVIMTFIYVSLYFVYIYCSIQGTKSKHTRFAQHRYFFCKSVFCQSINSYEHCTSHVNPCSFFIKVIHK